MPTVLVVDDLASDRLLAGRLLQNISNVDVIYACDGREALEQLEQHLPDVVVTDLQMPELNGLQLVEAVKIDYPLIPVILMTGKGSEEIAVQAIQRGAASYVSKQRLAKDLVEIVDRVLATSHEERNLTRLMYRLSGASFVLENDLYLISSLVSYLRHMLQERKLFGESDCLRIGTALDEALLNAYYHGNLEVSSALREQDHNEYHHLADQRRREVPYKDRRIHVHVEISKAEVTYVIRDEGPGFSPQDLPDPTDPEYLERPSGRGILLMRSFMDAMEFNATGNEVTLRKSFSKQHSADVEVPAASV